jgi:hypothetical protein
VAPWPEKLEIKVLGAADLTIRLIRTDSLTGRLMFCVQDLFDWRHANCRLSVRLKRAFGSKAHTDMYDNKPQ